jgi:uncharacterized protein (TIGR00251 family)
MDPTFLGTRLGVVPSAFGGQGLDRLGLGGRLLLGGEGFGAMGGVGGFSVLCRMTMGPELKADGSRVSFRVKVVPRASRTQVNGCVDGVLKLKVQAPPVEGAANEAVLRFLADTLDVAKSKVVVVRGETSRLKTIQVEGLSMETVRSRLGF